MIYGTPVDRLQDLPDEIVRPVQVIRSDGLKVVAHLVPMRR